MILDENLFETTLGDTIADSDQEQALERVEDSVDNKRQIEKFKKYMLPETILNYLYDYKYSDIASVLGISEARVRDHVRKNISELSKFLRYKTQPSPYLLKVEEQNKDVDLEKILSKGKPSEASLEESKKSEIKSEIKSAQGEIDYIKTATEAAKSHLESLKAHKDQYLPDPSDKRYDELLAKYEQLIKGFEETVDAGEKIIGEIKRKNSIKEELAPEQEKEYGLTTLINALIKDELEAIDGYNSAIVTLEAENKGEFTDVIRDIISEENTHIGQLQAILKELNPSTTADIDEGQQEGQKQIDQAVGATKGDTEETTTTIDTEEGVIKTYKLDKVEDMKESLSDKKLTKEEIKELALDNYEKGGDSVYECWDDRDIQEFIDTDGTKKGLMDIFKKYYSVFRDNVVAAHDANHLKPAEEESKEDDSESYPNDFRPDDDYDKDYGPNNPWDAPGMRVSDFIKGVK